MPSLSMVYDILARDAASPAFRTVAAEAKALQKVMVEADAKMSASSKAATSEINASLAGLTRAHDSFALQYDRANATIIASDDSLMVMQKKMAASTGALLAEQQKAAASNLKLDAAMAKGQADLAAKTEARSAATKGALLTVAKGTAVVGAAVIYESLKMAANFETVTNQLVTSAGEQESSLGLIRSGLLKMSREVGIGASELAKGMYQIESAGFHGAKGLEVMRAAAEGAKAEGAQTETVAKALTTVLNNFGDSIQNNAVKGTDFLVASVSLGKTRMEDFSAAISNVLPVAKSAGISLAEVGGAMSTMTSEGISADQAATYLRQTIVKLADQTPKAKNEMKALGLESINVAGNLGKRGLAGTLQVLTDAIEKHLGPGGLVELDSLKKAGQNAQKFQIALSNLPPAAQTYIGALTTMVGGQKTMMGALALTGPHMKTFRDDTAKIGAAMRGAGKDVNGWSVVQTSFNQKMSVFKANIGDTAIVLGEKLLPAASGALGEINKLFQGKGFSSNLRDKTNQAIADLFNDKTAAKIRPAANAWLDKLVNNIDDRSKQRFSDTFKDVKQRFSDTWHDVSTFAERIWKDVSGFFTRMWKDVSGFVSRIYHDATGFFGRMWKDARDITVSLWHDLVRIWHDISGFFTTVWNSIAGFFSKHWRLLLTIATGGLGLIYIYIQDHWKTISAFIARIWHDIVGFFERMWKDVSGFVSRLWKDVTGFFGRIWKDVTGWVSRLWNDLFGATKHGTTQVTGVVSDHVAKVDGWFSRMWKDVTGFVSRLWHDVAGFFGRMAADVWNVISPFVDRVIGGWTRIWHGTTRIVSTLWHDVTGFFGQMRDGVVRIFDDLVAKVGRTWDKVKDLVAVPIRWVIDNPYDKGIVPLIRGIGSVLHEPGMANLAPLHFAAGGVIPGNHARDTVPFFGTPGEVVVPLPAVARAGGAGALMNALGFGGGGGVGGHYDLGGIVKRIGHDIAHPMSAVGDLSHLVLGGLAAGAGPIVHALESTADSILGGMGGMGAAMARLVHTIGDKLLAFIAGKDSPAGGAPGAAGGAAQWAGVVTTALGMLGQPTSLVAGILSLINSESGGNPNAINLTDSNAIAGHPSRGLMQAIPSTFEAYRSMMLPDNIVDPLANVYAGINYALKNYGPGMLAAGGRHSAGGGYLGYAAGGVPPIGVPYKVGEDGPETRIDFRPGRILSHRDSMAAFGGRNAPLVGTVHIHDNVGLDLLLREAQFRESAGHFG